MIINDYFTILCAIEKHSCMRLHNITSLCRIVRGSFLLGKISQRTSVLFLFVSVAIIQNPSGNTNTEIWLTQKYCVRNLR